MKSTIRTVEAYIETFPADVRALLKKMRATVRAAAPDAVESMSYGMAGYKLAGRPLVYFGGFKGHVGFFATPSGHAAFAKETAKYKGAKGSVRFPIAEPLPLALVARMVKFRVKENLAAAKQKK